MTHPHSHLWPGVPLALFSAVLFGASAPFAKLLLGAVSPQLLAGLLYLGAGIGLAVVQGSRAAFGISAPEAPLRRHDLPWLAAVVLFGGFAGPLLLMLGLAHTSAASGSLLLMRCRRRGSLRKQLKQTLPLRCHGAPPGSRSEQPFRF